MMNIVVNASALRFSGGLIIYKQFLTHLKDNVRGNNYYIFIDSSMPISDIPGVNFIYDDNHSWIHRIYWDFCGCTRWFKQKNITPDLFISLQNTGVITKHRQIIYYHQSLPFYKRKWNIFKRNELIMWLYSKIYPLFVKPTINESTYFIAQIPFIKKGIINKFRVRDNHVFTLFPDVERINTDEIKGVNWDEQYFHFIYPATFQPYKEHRTILKALISLKESHLEAFSKIKIHFTLSANNAKELVEHVESSGLSETIIFTGTLPHEQLLSYYKSSDALIFPSTIETLGLPLLEATSFGLPILVSDLQYAHEVLLNYEGGIFINPSDISSWANSIKNVVLHPERFPKLAQSTSSWPAFFDIVDNKHI